MCLGDLHLDHSFFVGPMLAACIRLGIAFTRNERIGALNVRDGHADRGCGAAQWQTEAVVLAAGAWSSGVLTATSP